jgi:hypothetical protein
MTSSSKPVVFTRHAKQRMADPGRGTVSEEQVLAVFANPGVSYVGVDGKLNVLWRSAASTCVSANWNKPL